MMEWNSPRPLSPGKTAPAYIMEPPEFFFEHCNQTSLSALSAAVVLCTDVPSVFPIFDGQLQEETNPRA